MLADRSIAVDLFSDNVFETVERGEAPKRNTRKNQPEKRTGEKNNTNKTRMLDKLEDEAFGDFDQKDWFQYFVLKAEEQGVRYLVRNYAKDYTILKSILSELSWVDLKLMIDFVWESDQDIVDKQTMGVWVLSKGWINSIYQSSILWRDGKYRPKTAPTHNREWIAEASTKKKSGLSYGKPVRFDDEEEELEVVDTKPKKKVRIGLGLR